MDDIRQLCDHVAYRLGQRAVTVQRWRLDQLVSLVIREWPHQHLEMIESAGGVHHKTIDHAMALVRAGVREQWEAANGVGPLWQMLLAGTVDAISRCILDLWWQDVRWRMRLADMAGRVGVTGPT